MPTDEKILGFTNQWYSDGIATAVPYLLPSGRQIMILTLPYFIATKLEAFLSRGQGDPRISPDMEDICFVLDGCKEPLKQIQAAPIKLQNYLASTFSRLFQMRDFSDAIEGHLAIEGSERVKRLLDIMKVIAN